ncbi:MAG: thiamine diphosphokinase [Flavobacteriaceae bacterium]|nr:thiamine diphosphokinase [Flavobacteriaceae bacterium]
MSSHHVVRDKQEPALVIANGAACNFELLGQLLEWSPFLLVLDGALERVLSMGLKVDAVLGDFDRETNPESLLTHQPETEIIHTPNQAKCDLEKGIDFLVERGFNAANIVWATGRRADHTLNNIGLLAKLKTKLDLVMIDDHSRIYPLRPDFEKWYVKGTPLSLMPITQVEGVNTRGLKYDLSNDTLIPGHRSSSSNEAAADGFVKISHNSGDLLLMECWD